MTHKRYSQLREAAITLKNIEPELKECHGYKRSLAAEQAIEHIVKDKRDIAVMLSNLINDSSTENISKREKERDVNNSMPPEDNSIPVEDKMSSRLWKCNLDAFLNNPGITNFPAFDESKAFNGRTLFVQSTKSKYISEEDESEIRRIFPNAEFAWIKCKTGSTWFHVEKHTEFMQAIVGFLEDSKIRNENNATERLDNRDVAEKQNQN
jgi:pimeloyl-ACP methyl ester carboxylesterase